MVIFSATQQQIDPSLPRNVLTNVKLKQSASNLPKVQCFVFISCFASYIITRFFFVHLRITEHTVRPPNHSTHVEWIRGTQLVIACFGITSRKFGAKDRKTISSGCWMLEVFVAAHVSQSMCSRLIVWGVIFLPRTSVNWLCEVAFSYMYVSEWALLQ